MSATTPATTPVTASEDVTEVGTDVAVRTDPRAVIAALVKGEATVYSSFTGTAFDDKIKVLQALTDTVPIADHLGEVINLTNVLVQGVDIADPKTGESVTAPRVILVDADGTAYAGVSSGLLRSLENIFSILGQPASWSKPLACSVVEQRARSGFKFFTIKTV